MSAAPEPGGGLLGPLDAAFAGLRADDVTATTTATTCSTSSASGVDQVADDGRADLASSVEPSTERAPHRVVDPRAQAIADRLLGRPGDLVLWRLVDGSDRTTVVDQPLVVGRGVGNTVGDEDRADLHRDDLHRADLHRDEPAGADGDPDGVGSRYVVVPYAVVSRRHCRIELDGDRAVVRDLGSANGTVVLRHDTVIAIGDTPVVLCDGDVLATAGGRRRLVRVERSGATG